jgi:hypothetical protein
MSASYTRLLSRGHALRLGHYTLSACYTLKILSSRLTEPARHDRSTLFPHNVWFRLLPPRVLDRTHIIWATRYKSLPVTHLLTRAGLRQWAAYFIRYAMSNAGTYGSHDVSAWHRSFDLGKRVRPCRPYSRRHFQRWLGARHRKLQTIRRRSVGVLLKWSATTDIPDFERKTYLDRARKWGTPRKVELICYTWNSDD